jgi:hypothetical protein
MNYLRLSPTNHFRVHETPLGEKNEELNSR